MDVSKKDWKLFREKLSGWQEKYMEGLVKKYVNFLNDDTKCASEKFWKLEKQINGDAKVRCNMGYCSSYKTECNQL